MVTNRTQPDPDRHKDSLGYTQECRMQGIKAETLNNESREVRDTPVRDIRDEPQEEEQIGLVVKEGLCDLAPIDTSLFNARLVLPHTRNHQ